MRTLKDRRARINLLVRAGHSPEKAVEIAIDFERGDEFAMKWVRYLEAQDEKGCL